MMVHAHEVQDTAYSNLLQLEMSLIWSVVSCLYAATGNRCNETLEQRHEICVPVKLVEVCWRARSARGVTVEVRVKPTKRNGPPRESYNFRAANRGGHYSH